MVTYILLGVLSVLLVALVEAHDQAKRILAENRALEDKAQRLGPNYGY